MSPYRTLSLPKPLTINGVLIIGYGNAAKLLGASVPTIGKAIKYGHRCRGFVLDEVSGVWLDV